MKIEDIKVMCLDVESSGLDPFKDSLYLIAYRYNGEGPVYQVKVYDMEKPDDLFLQALASKDVVKRGQNLHFDLLFLGANGYSIGGVLDDTRIIAYLEDPNQELDLKTLVEKKLNRKPVRLEELGPNRLSKAVKALPWYVKSGKTYVTDKQKFEDYNKADVINCDDLRQAMADTSWYRTTEQPLASILFRMEQRGLCLDIPYLKELENEFETKIEELKERLPEELNPNSPKQVQAEFQRQGIRLDSTDKHTLKLLSWGRGTGAGLAGLLLEHRKYAKLLGTYVIPFLSNSDRDGRLHGRFNQAGREDSGYGDIKGTRTGRLSSSSPNLQNIPDRTDEGKKIRRSIIPTPGMILVDSDLKQIEPRLIAHYSQSGVLLNAYQKGLDTHAIMGGLIFGKQPSDLSKLERFIGKTSWLATVYGCWYKKLRLICEQNSEELLPYNDEFYMKVQSAFWQANPEIRNWKERLLSETRSMGFVETFGGRRIKIDGLVGRNKFEVNNAERTAINYKIQGSGADVAKLILVRAGQEWNGHILAVVHDSILGEALFAEAKDQLNTIMTTTVKLHNVPVDAETSIKKNWTDK